ncbi:fumarylacetoacetate hydrolase family protein [soil metagenome]
MAFAIPPMTVVGVPIVGSADTFPVRRVYCVGRNYAAHAREMGFDPDREPPFFFSKANDASSMVVVPAGKTVSIPYPPQTKNLHYEAELVVAIGKSGKNIPIAEASSYIWGFAAGLDMTRRDLQIAAREKGRPWEVGKAFDYAAPIGPITPIAQAKGVAKAGITLEVDGVVKQQATMAHLIWSIDEVIANLSELFTLEPGDLIYSGTPEGVGAVVSGNTMVVKIDGLESITVKVA